MSISNSEKNSIDNQRCQEMLANAVKNNEKIHKLVDSIEELGCSIPKNFFSCRQCEGEISGGFVVNSENEVNYQPKVVLCENFRLNKTVFETTIIHELVHAYDACRSKISFNNCLQHACTEIRASALSGECDLSREINRGNFQFKGGYKDCVSRRALLSVQMNPSCKDVAKKAVETAMEKCYTDTSPFKEL